MGHKQLPGHRLSSCHCSTQGACLCAPRARNVSTHYLQLRLCRTTGVWMSDFCCRFCSSHLLTPLYSFGHCPGPNCGMLYVKIMNKHCMQNAKEVGHVWEPGRARMHETPTFPLLVPVTDCLVNELISCLCMWTLQSRASAKALP